MPKYPDVFRAYDRARSNLKHGPIGLAMLAFNLTSQWNELNVTYF